MAQTRSSQRLPRVAVLSLGGTIASLPTADEPGVVPSLDAADLVHAVPQLAELARVHTEAVRQVPSGELTFADLLAVRDAVQEQLAAGTAGCVITQGTDTIEESAFALELLCGFDAPIVVTGAMRSSAQPGADGPANLLAAVGFLTRRNATPSGTVVILNDQIHAARFVRKMHTARLDAFGSPTVGPIGWVAEGIPHVPMSLRPLPHVALPSHAAVPPVCLYQASLSDDGRLLDEVIDAGFKGLVVAGVGGGHVPSRVVPALASIALQIPVVLCSRTGAGSTLEQTYGYAGSELELLRRGLIPSGMLDGPKARVLLALSLAAGDDEDGVRRRFAEVARSGHAA